MGVSAYAPIDLAKAGDDPAQVAIGLLVLVAAGTISGNAATNVRILHQNQTPNPSYQGTNTTNFAVDCGCTFLVFVWSVYFVDVAQF